jgi:hypothetical protein
MKKLSAAAVIVLAVAGLLSVVVGQAQAVPLWGPATPASFEPGVQSSPPSTFLNKVSCASAGNCTGVGFFQDSSGDNVAFAQTQTGGVWATPVAFQDTILLSSSSTIVDAVSCASAGNCTAVGSFTNVDGDREAFAQTQTNGVWGQAVPAVFAGGVQNVSPSAVLVSVSCSSPGNCTAVGDFSDVNSHSEGFAQTQTDGTWGQAVPTTISIATPHDATRGDELDSVSCASAGNCTAVGNYRLSYGQVAAFAQTQTDGVWSDAIPAQFAGGVVDNAGDGSRAVEVSCAGVGNCTAIGVYRATGGENRPFMQTQTDGVWSQVDLPTFAAGEDGEGRFDAVSCSGVGECTAVGTVEPAGTSHGFAVTQTGGAWGEAVLMPVDALNIPNPHPHPYSVSCPSTGNCTVVGEFTDAYGNTNAFTLTQMNGTWDSAAPANFADGMQNANPESAINDVSCASAGNCTAVGYFLDADNGYQGFSQTLANGVAPVNAGGANAPTIAGTAMVGETLTAGHGTWSNPPASENLYGYLWEVSANGTNGWAPITDADPNLRTFVVPAAYEGKYLRVQVTAYGDVASEPAYSAVTARITGRGSPSAEPSPITPRVAATALAQVYSPAPGITVGATRGAVGLAASARAACRDLVRGANFWVRSTSTVTCLKSSLPAALSLRNGLVQAATPGTYPIKVQVSRANGTKVIRAITITVV